MTEKDRKILLFFTDRSVIIFQFNAFIKAPPKTLRFVYDYAKGDFEGLRTALSAINLSSIIANDDINTGWHQWKTSFLVRVSDYIQTKRFKEWNPYLGCLVPYVILSRKRNLYL